MNTPYLVTVRAKPYRCTHKTLRVPYWSHRAYELEIVGHGHTMAPSRSKVAEWAADWLLCTYGAESETWEMSIEWL